MAKAKKIVVEETVGTDNPVNTLETLSKEELVIRYKDNVAERQRLADENKFLVQLHKTATSTAKIDGANAKIAALQAKLAALTTPSVIEGDSPAIEAPATESLAM
jgi:hypothetical protein